MKLSILIVSFNTKELLDQCLSSLFKNYGRDFREHRFEVVVIDNASSDDSVQMIRKNFPRVKLIINKENTGFARANNKAVKKACGSFVLYLNPDTIVPQYTLKRMLAYMENNPRVGIATSKVILPNGEIDDASHRGFPTPWRALTHFSGLGRLFPWTFTFNGYHLGFRQMTQIHEIDACVGAFLLLRKDVGTTVNFFDEDYFWYGEDIDLCYRVKMLGFKVMYVPDVYITHYKGAASGIKRHTQSITKADKSTRMRATRARFEVMRIFYRKHYLSLYPKWITQFVFWGIDWIERIISIKI